VREQHKDNRRPLGPIRKPAALSDRILPHRLSSPPTAATVWRINLDAAHTDIATANGTT
jgi:hypothetical protein